MIAQLQQQLSAQVQSGQITGSVGLTQAIAASARQGAQHAAASAAAAAAQQRHTPPPPPSSDQATAARPQQQHQGASHASTPTASATAQQQQQQSLMAAQIASQQEAMNMGRAKAKTLPCKFHLMGRCAYGDRCAYNHDISAAAGAPSTPQQHATAASSQQQHPHVSERYLDQVLGNLEQQQSRHRQGADAPSTARSSGGFGSGFAGLHLPTGTQADVTAQAAAKAWGTTGLSNAAWATNAASAAITSTATAAAAAVPSSASSLASSAAAAAAKGGSRANVHHQSSTKPHQQQQPSTATSSTNAPPPGIGRSTRDDDNKHHHHHEEDMGIRDGEDDTEYDQWNAMTFDLGDDPAPSSSTAAGGAGAAGNSAQSSDFSGPPPGLGIKKGGDLPPPPGLAAAASSNDNTNNTNNKKKLFLHDFRIKTSANGYPAYTGAQHQFVSKEIPVILLKDVPRLGVKGEIVMVRRGRARHFLVPQKQAVYASLWENVDMYADPNLINRTAATIVGVGAKGESRPFDWIQEITLQFICETRGSGESSEEPLADPLSYVDILEALSQQHELDLLPNQLEMPHGNITHSGVHEIKLTLPFKTWTGTYNVKVHVKSRAALEAARKRAAEARKAKLAELAKFDFKEEKPIATDLSGAWAEDEEKEDEDKTYLMYICW
ncbi:hypothetical protein FOZ63_028388, partial [Perkinsus olseni]